jgi:propanol-preferring alcohol dehydrogenase
MTQLMQAMLLEEPGKPLRFARLPRPLARRGELILRVSACGICRTDLHIADGELAHPKLPLVLGHEIVGTVVASGPGVEGFSAGDRVGVPWLGWTCGTCRYCLDGRENLCDRAKFTGYHRDGGYAEYTSADARYCFPLPPDYHDVQLAPLLCAGLIGYRSLRAVGEAERLGIYGFGAAAHLICQLARFQGRKVFAFTRPGDHQGQEFALELGAVWAGSSAEFPPEPLDGAIIFAPVGDLVPAALRAVTKGGTVVCAGIHMSSIPAFPYEILWGERTLRSVANLTRSDGEEFLRLIQRVPLRVEVARLPLAQANQGLEQLRAGLVRGAVVLVPPGQP